MKRRSKSTVYSWLSDIFKTAFAAMPGLSRNYLTKELDYLAGLETEFENPDQLLTDKGQDATFYDKLLLDSTIATSLDLKKAITLAVDGHVRATSEDQADKDRAEWLDKMLYMMKPDIWTTFDNALDAWVYGYKIGEKRFGIGEGKNYDGKWILKQILFKHSTFFDFGYDEYANLNELKIGYNYGESTSIKGYNNIFNKFAIMVWPYPIDGNWYGQSDLMAIYLQYYTKYQIYRWRGIYLQNFGMPVMVANYVPKEMNSTEINELEDQLQNWQEQMFIKVPNMRNNKTGELQPKIKLELLEKKSTSTEAFEKSIQQLDNDIRRRLLVPDNVGYSTQQVGSLAKSKTELDVFLTVIRDVHGKLEDFINPHIRQIETINFGEVENYSEWHFSEIDKRIEAQALKMLIDSGVVDPREQWTRDYLGIPQITIEEKEALDSEKKEKPKKPISQSNEPENEMPDSGIETEEGEQFKQDKFPFNPKPIEKRLNTAENDFIQEYNEAHKINTEMLIGQVKKKYNLEKKNYKWLTELHLNDRMLKDIFTVYYFNLYFGGKEDAIKEVDKKIKKIEKQKMTAFSAVIKRTFSMFDDTAKETVNDWSIHLKEYGSLGAITREDAKQLNQWRQKAVLAAQEDGARILKESQNYLRNSLDTDRPLRDVIAGMEEVMTADRKKYALTIARTNAASAYNIGRLIEFMSDAVRPFIEAYQYQAILDDRTTEFCKEHDGQIIKKNDPRLGIIWPPNHFNALLPDTKIKTRRGIIDIKDVRKGDEVITHKLKYQPVYDTMLEFRQEDIYEIELENGQKLKITGDHPINADREWKDAKDLKVGDDLIVLTTKNKQRATLKGCLQCGKELKIKGKKKNDKFCNQKCMGEYYIKHDFQCIACGKKLIGKWKTKKAIYKNRRFCSRQCYLRYKGRSSLEEKIARILDKMNIRYVEQAIAGRYLIDFVLIDYKIAIEADGNYWHDIRERWNVRSAKEQFIAKSGLTLYRFGQDSILDYKFEKELKEVLNAHKVYKKAAV